MQPQITVKIEVSPEKNLGYHSPPLTIPLQDMDGAATAKQLVNSGTGPSGNQRRSPRAAGTSLPRSRDHILGRSEDSGTTPSSIGAIGLEHKHVYCETGRPGGSFGEAERDSAMSREQQRPMHQIRYVDEKQKLFSEQVGKRNGLRHQPLIAVATADEGEQCTSVGGELRGHSALSTGLPRY